MSRSLYYNSEGLAVAIRSGGSIAIKQLFEGQEVADQVMQIRQLVSRQKITTDMLGKCLVDIENKGDIETAELLVRVRSKS